MSKIKGYRYTAILYDEIPTPPFQKGSLLWSREKAKRMMGIGGGIFLYCSTPKIRWYKRLWYRLFLPYHKRRYPMKWYNRRLHD